MSTDLAPLRGKRVLVTGGTGFIGGRVVERLVLDAGAIPRVLVRQFVRASRIARLPVELLEGEVTNPDDVRRSAEGCDTIIHCAHGGTTLEEQRAINVGGTRNVLSAARSAGVRRVVHVSSVTVYGLPLEGEIDESSPRIKTGDFYTDTKIEAEQVAIDAYREHGLPVVVVQPTVVYGPYGSAWTINVLRNLAVGRQILVNGGSGICNAVYVDDVVSSLLQAAVREGVVGEVFLVSGAEPTTWGDFFRRFEQMLGEPATVSMTEKEACEYFARQQKRRSLLRESLDILRSEQSVRARVLESREMNALLTAARAILPDSAFHRMKQRIKGGAEAANGHRPAAASVEKPARPIHPRLVRFYASKMRVRIEKAQRQLGYAPRFDFDSGMDLTERWARWANLLPSRPAPAASAQAPVASTAAR